MNIFLERKVNEIGEWLGPGTLNFFARPFGGKDTNGEKFAKAFNVPLLGGGAILRESVIPDDVRQRMEEGELIPSEDFAEYVMPFLGQAAFEGKPLVFSAVGRVIGEEEGVIEATTKSGHPTMAVPYLDITEDEAFRRLQETPPRDRADDTPEKLRTRLDEYNAKTVPVLDIYEEMGLLVRVNAMPAADIVFAALVNQLHERATAA